jgi:hypothetical protein
MPAPESWIPLRWPSAWVDPALLRLLEGTPFNCLVVEWGAALAPVIAGARAAGIALAAAGNEAQRSAGAGAGLAVLPMAEQSRLPWKSPEPVLIAADRVWPGIARPASGAELSGPTANPWIDSNGWFLRLAQVRAPQKILWLMFDPPGPPNAVLLDSYLRAIADTGAWGGRWVVSLDSSLQNGVARGDEKAVESWKAISAAVAFFEKHRQWTAFEPLGVVGVISDFAGPNEVLGQEVLNLLGRRNLVCPRRRCEANCWPLRVGAGCCWWGLAGTRRAVRPPVWITRGWMSAAWARANSRSAKPVPPTRS